MFALRCNRFTESRAFKLTSAVHRKTDNKAQKKYIIHTHTKGNTPDRLFIQPKRNSGVRSWRSKAKKQKPKTESQTKVNLTHVGSLWPTGPRVRCSSNVQMLRNTSHNIVRSVSYGHTWFVRNESKCKSNHMGCAYELFSQSKCCD